MLDNKIYEAAKEAYAKIGVDTDAAIKRVSEIPVSIHCWQGDDLRGFENPDGDLTGGIQTTGNYPGRAKNMDQLRGDFEFAASLIPGKKRIALHAIHLDNGGKKIERNEILPEHFDSWIDWALDKGFGVDMNPTYFSHPLSSDGLTLSHPDAGIRKFWIEHGIASCKIAEHIGKRMNDTTITNHWIPDGYKDIPIDRYAARERLADSYDKIFAVKTDSKYNKDSLESKLFGIGAESCTVGSGEFYLGYAQKNDKLLTLDTGHFHPTEVVSDKLSSVMLFLKEAMLHVSRPVRWDSDHVVIFDDELKNIALEILRNNFENRIHVGLDFFDASINRIAAWVIGSRNMQKALLYAALEPTAMMKKLELDGDNTARLAWLEECKTLPFDAVFAHYCDLCNVPDNHEWIGMVKQYEKDVLSLR